MCKGTLTALAHEQHAARSWTATVPTPYDVASRFEVVVGQLYAGEQPPRSCQSDVRRHTDIQNADRHTRVTVQHAHVVCAVAAVLRAVWWPLTRARCCPRHFSRHRKVFSVLREPSSGHSRTHVRPVDASAQLSTCPADSISACSNGAFKRTPRPRRSIASLSRVVQRYPPVPRQSIVRRRSPCSNADETSLQSAEWIEAGERCTACSRVAPVGAQTRALVALHCHHQHSGDPILQCQSRARRPRKNSTRQPYDVSEARTCDGTKPTPDRLSSLSCRSSPRTTHGL